MKFVLATVQALVSLSHVVTAKVSDDLFLNVRRFQQFQSCVEFDVMIDVWSWDRLSMPFEIEIDGGLSTPFKVEIDFRWCRFCLAARCLKSRLTFKAFWNWDWISTLLFFNVCRRHLCLLSLTFNAVLQRSTSCREVTNWSQTKANWWLVCLHCLFTWSVCLVCRRLLNC